MFEIEKPQGFAKTILEDGKVTLYLVEGATINEENVNRIVELLNDKNKQKDKAYTERNKLVCALSKLFPAKLSKTDIEGWDPEWQWCVYIDLPSGQASWHIQEKELIDFDHLDCAEVEWDGHTTEEKYARLAELSVTT